MTRRRPVSSLCPMDAVLHQIMGRWTTYILWLLQSRGPLRFGTIRAQMPDISSKVLTERLRHLEAARLIHRDHRPTIPPSVTYSLTGRATQLGQVLSDLNAIASQWAAEDRAAADREAPESAADARLAG